MRRAALTVMIWGIATAAWAACGGSSPTWTVAASGTAAEVALCITAASAGDTIVLPAGTFDWTTGGGVTLNKAVTLKGMGTGCPGACDNATTLQIGSGTIAVTATVDDWRITGITFEGASNGTGAIYVNAGGTADATGWRIDHCHFKDATGRGISVGTYASVANYAPDFPGLIDNNRFSASARFKAVQAYGGSMNTYGSWADTLTLGGESFLFIEDNHFVHTTMPDGVSSIDGDTGARMVIRYNTFTNGDLSAHGQEACSDIDADATCQWKSTHGWEVYGNTFAYDTTHSFVINYRGGTGVIWNNAMTGTASGFPAVRYLYERGDLERTCLDAGACQGSSAYDGNETDKYGYACWQQIGMTGSDGITKMPVYQWSNVAFGEADEATLTGVSFEAACNYQHVQEGRDILFAGDGTLASRPASCTTGDGYWATDQGSWNAATSGADGLLYRCAATDTWALHYTPYAYPHPLRAVPAAPTNVR